MEQKAIINAGDSKSAAGLEFGIQQITKHRKQITRRYNEKER